jgi:uncharacterized protein (DUF169 family)
MAGINDLLKLIKKDELSYADASDIFERLLKLDFPPVAVKYFFDEKEMNKYKPDMIPVHPITYCAFIAASRSAGYILISSKDNLGCINAKYVFGWKDSDDNVVNTHMKYANDRAQAEMFVKTKPGLPYGELKGFMTAPLERTPVEPDIVHFICNPLQAYHILNDYMGAFDIHPLTFTQTINSTVCSGDVTVYLTRKPNMNTMCSGSYTSGKTERGEVNVVIPGNQIGAVARRMLKRTVRDKGVSFPHTGNAYPGFDVCKACQMLAFKKNERK